MLLLPDVPQKSKTRNVSGTPLRPHAPSARRRLWSALAENTWQRESGGAGFFFAFDCNKVFGDSLPLTSPFLHRLPSRILHGP